MLDVCCDPRGVMSTQQWSRPETKVSTQTTCRHAVRIAMAVCVRGSVVPAKFLLVLLNTLPVEDETSNALVVVWVGNEARCVSRDVTPHRLSA